MSLVTLAKHLPLSLTLHVGSREVGRGQGGKDQLVAEGRLQGLLHFLATSFCEVRVRVCCFLKTLPIGADLAASLALFCFPLCLRQELPTSELYLPKCVGKWGLQKSVGKKDRQPRVKCLGDVP